MTFSNFGIERKCVVINDIAPVLAEFDNALSPTVVIKDYQLSNTDKLRLVSTNINALISGTNSVINYLNGVSENTQRQVTANFDGGIKLVIYRTALISLKITGPYNFRLAEVISPHDNNIMGYVISRLREFLTFFLYAKEWLEGKENKEEYLPVEKNQNKSSAGYLNDSWTNLRLGLGEFSYLAIGYKTLTVEIETEDAKSFALAITEYLNNPEENYYKGFGDNDGYIRVIALRGDYFLSISNNPIKRRPGCIGIQFNAKSNSEINEFLSGVLSELNKFLDYFNIK